MTFASRISSEIWFISSVDEAMRLSGSEPTFSLVTTSRPIAALKGCRSVDFPGMRDGHGVSSLRPGRFIVRAVADTLAVGRSQASPPEGM